MSAADLPPAIIRSQEQVCQHWCKSKFVRRFHRHTIKYQWQQNAIDLPGATNKSLSFTNVQLAQAGDYRVMVANAFGSVTSVVATLDVDPVFTKIASATLNLSGGASGVAWADYNNDGFQDLLIVGKGGSTTALYTNKGDGTFTKLTSGTGIGGLIGKRFVADFDNDGYLDLVGGANLSEQQQRHVQQGALQRRWHQQLLRFVGRFRQRRFCRSLPGELLHRRLKRLLP
jgi:hypothetical protein